MEFQRIPPVWKPIARVQGVQRDYKTRDVSVPLKSNEYSKNNHLNLHPYSPPVPVESNQQKPVGQIDPLAKPLTTRTNNKEGSVQVVHSPAQHSSALKDFMTGDRFTKVGLCETVASHKLKFVYRVPMSCLPSRPHVDVGRSLTLCGTWVSQRSPFSSSGSRWNSAPHPPPPRPPRRPRPLAAPRSHPVATSSHPLFPPPSLRGREHISAVPSSPGDDDDS